MTEVYAQSKAVQIFADGACSGNPGPGGWGAVMRYGTSVKRICGYYPNTTNNRMELMAVIMALKQLKFSCRVEVYSDSQYVVKGMNEWIKGWKAKHWRKSNNKPVENDDLWKELDALASNFIVSFHWIKGHAGHPDNEEADRLATSVIGKGLSGASVDFAIVDELGA